MDLLYLNELWMMSSIGKLLMDLVLSVGGWVGVLHPHSTLTDSCCVSQVCFSLVVTFRLMYFYRLQLAHTLVCSDNVTRRSKTTGADRSVAEGPAMNVTSAWSI